MFNPPAENRIDELYEKKLLKGIIGTNAVYHDPKQFKKEHPWYHEVDITPYFAHAIFNTNHHQSLSQLL